MKIIIFLITILTPLFCIGQSNDYKLNQLRIEREKLSQQLNSIEAKIKEIDKEINLLNESLADKITTNELITNSIIVSDANVRFEPSQGDNILFKINKGEKVEVPAIEDLYYKIRYKNQIGLLVECT